MHQNLFEPRRVFADRLYPARYIRAEYLWPVASAGREQNCLNPEPVITCSKMID
jgi:hypothetical protein